MVAFAIVEGLFFLNSFTSIFYFKKRGIKNGLIQANELILRDETLHWKFACFIYKNKIRKKITNERILEIIEEAVDIEEEFYNKSLNVELIGMCKEDMYQYIKYMADGLLFELKCDKYNKVKCSFKFMENLTCHLKLQQHL